MKILKLVDLILSNYFDKSLQLFAKNHIRLFCNQSPTVISEDFVEITDKLRQHTFKQFI